VSSSSNGQIPSNPSDSKHFLSLMTDVAAEPSVILGAIYLNDIPILSLTDAIGCIKGIDLSAPLFLSKQFALELLEEGKEPISADHIGAIHIYSQETPLYGTLNSLLREPDRTKLKDQGFLPYLKLLMIALKLLPKCTLIVWRGVDKKLAKYDKGKKRYWWGFSSTTSSMEIAKSFFKDSPEATLFNIQTNSAINIQKYSAVPREEEYLLPAGISFEVVDHCEISAGLFIIQLKEDAQAPSFITGLL